MPGRIVNFEIPADDTAAATAFWGGLFGWTFDNPFPGGPGEYLITPIDGGGGAAITGMRPGERGPIVYLNVDDIDAGVARVTELGGEADPKVPVPGMGWFATCRDPHGNRFGIWQDDVGATMG